MENPLYGPGTGEVEFTNPLRGSKSIRLPEEDDIAAAKAQNNEEHFYMEPQDGALKVATNPCYASSPPLRVSFGDNKDKPQGDGMARAERDLEAFARGAKAEARASNAFQPKTFRRQRSDEKAKNDEERRALKRGEVPPSFENPFYGGVVRRDEGNSIENPTYSTIPASHNGRPRLPPRPSRRSYEEPSETLEVQEDDTYESLNFGHTDA